MANIYPDSLLISILCANAAVRMRIGKAELLRLGIVVILKFEIWKVDYGNFLTLTNTILRYLLICLIPFCLFACGDSDGEPQFHGIYELNDSGLPLGGTDASDWLQQDEFTAKELALFPEYADLNINNEGVSSTSAGGKFIVFPNPTTNLANIHQESDSPIAWGKMCLVDTNYKIVWELKILDTNVTYLLTFGSKNLPKSTYRLYYVYKLEGEEYIFKGHGDIKYY